MKTKRATNFKAALRLKLVEHTGCAIQHNGWPCNSCFHAIDLPLEHDIHDYWLSVLGFRGDYPHLNADMDLLMELYINL